MCFQIYKQSAKSAKNDSYVSRVKWQIPVKSWDQMAARFLKIFGEATRGNLRATSPPDFSPQTLFVMMYRF